MSSCYRTERRFQARLEGHWGWPFQVWAAFSAFRWSDYVGLQWCQRQSVSATRSLMTLMTIWIEDFLFSNSLGVKPSKLLVSISPLPNTLSLYIGAVLARPPQNKLICFSDAVLLFQCCGVETKYVISDEWASEQGWNSYFVGTRYNKGLGSRPGHHG